MTRVSAPLLNLSQSTCVQQVQYKLQIQWPRAAMIHCKKDRTVLSHDPNDSARESKRDMQNSVSDARV